MFFSQPIHANESFLTPKTMVKIHFLLGKKIASRFPLYAPTAGTQLRDYACPFQQLHLHAVLEVGCLCWLLPHGLSICCCRCFPLDMLEAAAIPGVRAAPWGRMSAPRRVGSTGQVTPQEPAGLCTSVRSLGMGRGSVSGREQGSLSVCSQGMSSRSPMCLARQTQPPGS